jgi:hypothetical protein
MQDLVLKGNIKSILIVWTTQSYVLELILCYMNITVRTRVIFLEVDEDQHKFGADGGTIRCDMKRMSNVIEALAMDGNTLPICFVRYNPNAFRINGKLQHI